MPKFQVERSILINCEQSDAFECVKDLRRWNVWSPWLLAEPAAKVSFAKDGRKYSWDGEIVGAGELELIGAEASQALHFKLSFLKPWKSTSAVSFYFENKNGATLARWTMEGGLPFFLFFMKGMMTAMISRDYDRGLLMLKDLLETGGVPSKLEFAGLETIAGFEYVYVGRDCKIEEIGEKLSADMESLSRKAQESGLIVSGKPFALYPKYNPAKGSLRYEVALPVVSGSKRPDGLKKGVFEETRTYAIRHKGPYRHLGNAWAAGMMHSRAKVFPADRKKVSFEVYANDPCTVAESEILTTVHFPVK